MPSVPQSNDLQLTSSDIRQLAHADQIADFFAQLGYSIDARVTIKDYAVLNLGSEELRQHIHRIERIGNDPDDGNLIIYLLEVRSVTAWLRNTIARRFRDRLENALLVLTKNYDQLEFVLLERRVVPGQRRGQAMRQIVRPIPLAIERQIPSTVALRVLRRLTYTEIDSDYQWEKLRSAYVLVEWSEEYFNNRALFSDYYLTQRLTDPRLMPAWAEDVTPIGREVLRLLASARQEYTRQPAHHIRTSLYEPLFKLLGFTAVAQKAASAGEATADYLLYSPEQQDVPLAAALTYVWNRNLDDIDETRELAEDAGGTPMEIPGALVVSLLEAQHVPWVIVTNGKLWRLYSATASNKATNYYEIDLEEALSAADQPMALRYWWLLFRRQAFTGFLDTLVKQSAEYAKDLGDRLKDRVFEEVFPQFAQGFIANIRAKEKDSAHPLLPSSSAGRGAGDDGAALDQIFSGTMTFLYRLMFVLYAESLELLPVSETNGYYQLSLALMKQEIATIAGTVADEAPQKLEKHYSATTTALYDRLRALFDAIDTGSDALNMPSYNGGLFSQTTTSGQFLTHYAIPDRFLARGLDRLARALDSRTQALVFIDFKSLGVRHLGSIYEGLLEFRLRIASEKLAVTREKDKEVYQPFAKVKKPLAVIEPGEAYLENDKQERKATGSYYTPDYIVKYIVQHTVGPVLDRLFTDLAPRLRAAQKGYREYARMAEARRKTLYPSSPTLLPQGEKGVSGTQSVPSSPTLLPQGEKGATLPGEKSFDHLEISPELKKQMTEIARRFRKEPTRSEDTLWQAIRDRKLGHKFRRQQPIGPFVLDFYCADQRLAVEVDGKIHVRQQEADHQRQAILETLGIRFVRLSADHVENDLSTALATIRTSFLPSPQGGKGVGGEANTVPQDGRGARGEDVPVASSFSHADLPLSPTWERGSGGEGDNPATYWNRPDMRQLVDDCLTIRCLDPAMGSGHFLVEVVDYVSNRLISFLNAWSENPVWAFLNRTRDDILNDMERQHVTINAERLTRVALLKRAVLKRCVYGVDLNAMAVELAKVSLWLDAFTLGAPLSFLDHHLKHGNSLVGARIREVQDYLKASAQLDMFSGSKFAGVMLATDLMRQVSYLSDNTVEQTRRSADAYRDASDHLAPYKRVLDVYTSRWFGNPMPQKGKSDQLRLFLEEPRTEDWLKDPTTKLDDSLVAATTIAQTALRAAEEKRFFHWELEFPEVFFAPSTPGGQDVQLVEGGGFDAVVGNPPYADIKGLEEVFTRYLFGEYQLMELRVNIFAAFIERMLRSTLSYQGLLGFIIPTAFLTQVSYSSLRKHILQKHQVNKIIRLPNEIFGNAVGEVKVDTCILILSSLQGTETHEIEILIYEGFIRRELIAPETAVESFKVKPQFWLNQEESTFTLVHPKEVILLQKIETNSVSLEKLCEFCLGITPYDKYRGHSQEQINNKVFHANKKQDDTYKPLLVSGDVGRYTVTWNGSEWLKYGEWLAAPREQRFFTEERILIQQIIDWSTLRILVGWTKDELYNTQNQFNLLAYEGTNLKYLLAILNSSIMTYYHRHVFLDVALQRFQKILIKDARRFPIRQISFTTPAAERTQLTQAAIASYDVQDNTALLSQTRAAIDAEKTDIVHDVLAHLAQRMIDLNKEKQAEVKRFLDWLENVLWPPHPTSLSHKGRATSPTSATPPPLPVWERGAGGEGMGDGPGGEGIGAESGGEGHTASEGESIANLSGKSILQNYLGDYQKGEPPQPWSEFSYRLYQNRNRFRASLSERAGQIEQHYEQSLELLLPIKRELARTDMLIDKIVYQLYGLTEAEIELIERPQYAQALSEAKAQVVADTKIKDEEVRLERIAEKILPASERFFERVEPKSDEATLDADLPGWRSLPPAAPTFLLTGDYNLRTLPEQMDFSSSIIPYTKAVEVVIFEHIFAPFRAAGTPPDSCKNSFLKDFLAGKKHLTLGSFSIILKSTEPALRGFIQGHIQDAATRIFGADGAVALLDDPQMVYIRNKAAHDEVLTRHEAQIVRAWAIGILGLVY